ncbi:hypothetical protein SERLA73DRAFT_157196 [Serpula lacrymans var. lacrymans S7.3]|uniref:Retrotransposon gag domain-containing protein n=1 Tax=Serpula lacrymans var. lacrymans (strain S7.3) TaxID=936435 RepID=F8QHW7_SERL3|nr:hypothetical protein SERLA73DRAFT_157196 [Serpula lacrymans var. lacrymans S7.3]
MSSQNPDIKTLLHGMRAAPPAAASTVEKKFNKKVEAVADPGAFKGDRAQFAKWWIKLQIWVKANWDAFADNFEICTFKQGNMRTDNYVTRFLALSIQGGLGNKHAVELLERNVNPHIAEQIYLQDMRQDNLFNAAEEYVLVCNTATVDLSWTILTIQLL